MVTSSSASPRLPLTSRKPSPSKPETGPAKPVNRPTLKEKTWRPDQRKVLFGFGSGGTYVFSHSGPIQAGAEKLGICGSVRGRLGTLGRGTLARLFVNDLPVSAGGEVRSMVEKKC